MKESENASGQIKRIVILGGGVTGWTVAAGLSHGLRGLNIEIVLIESEINAEQDNLCETTLPSANMFHKILGIDEQKLLAATGSTYTLATRYHGWSFAEQNYYLPFSDHGFMLNRIEFQHYIASRYSKGVNINYDDYSLSAVAARLGRFRHPSSQSDSIYSSITYGLNINIPEYARCLQQVAQESGVHHIKSKVISVDVANDNGYIDALVLSDSKSSSVPFIDSDGKIYGDFFIDCSGVRGRLIHSEMEVGFRGEDNVLFSNRMFTTVKPTSLPIPSSSSLTPYDFGWQRQIVTGTQAISEYYYDRNLSSDEQILQSLGISDATGVFFRDAVNKRRTDFWIKNCLAIGESTGGPGNFVVNKLHVIQSAVLRFLTLFPSTRESESNSVEYNRLTHLEYDHIFDFHALHYKLATTLQTPFWQMANAKPLSDRMQYKMDLFVQRGIISFYEGETLSAGMWISFLLGQNVWPQRYDPLVDGMPADWVNMQLQKMKQVMHDAAAAMPSHGDYLVSKIYK